MLQFRCLLVVLVAELVHLGVELTHLSFPDLCWCLYLVALVDDAVVSLWTWLFRRFHRGLLMLLIELATYCLVFISLHGHLLQSFILFFQSPNLMILILLHESQVLFFQLLDLLSFFFCLLFRAIFRSRLFGLRILNLQVSEFMLSCEASCVWCALIFAGV